MAKISAEQAASALYDAGFRGDDLAKMVAIGDRESAYTTDAHRTDQDKSKLSGDRGLFQINYVHDKALMQAGIINGKQDLFDPAVNAKAAFYLYEQSGDLSDWSAGPGGWQANGDPLYGTDYSKAQTAVSNFMSEPEKYGGNKETTETEAISSAGTPKMELVKPETVTRNTEYDPTYTPPVADPEAQKGLTDMLGRFGIDYPEAPRATPQLLAFMRGLGMSYDQLEDNNRREVSQIEGRSADSMADIARSDQRNRQGISDVQQSRNTLSSGATNTKFARQAENVVSAQADVQRNEADAIGDSSSRLAAGQDDLRLSANERVINEETKQANEEAAAIEQVRDFNARLEESEYQNAQTQAAQDAWMETQVNQFNTIGLGV